MTTSNDEAIGVALRALRKSARMTLSDVSALAGISAAYLSNVENGHVSPSANWVHAVMAAIGTRILTGQRAAA